MESEANLFLRNFDSTWFLLSKATRMAEGPEQAWHEAQEEGLLLP